MHTAVNPLRTAGVRCPGCLSPNTPGSPHCRACGIWLAGPQFVELTWINAELTRVDVARTQLISRRAALLDELTRLARQKQATAAHGRPAAGQAAPGEAAAGRGRQAAGQSAAGREQAAAAERARRHEISGRAAALFLLAAGAILVAIAVTIFTVADWGRIGPLGRCAILLAATALVLAAPRPFVRRGLDATAESVAAIGLVLTLGDAFLIQRFAGLQPGPLAASAFCAAMATAWAAYGASTSLRGPRLAALGLAQLITPLAFTGIAGLLGGPGTPMAGPIATGLVVSAAGDIVLAGGSGRRGSRQPSDAERLGHAVRPGFTVATGGFAAAAAAIAAAAWTCGVLIAAAGLAFGALWSLTWSGLSSGDSIWLALAFASAAVVGVRGPSRSSSLASVARPAAVISGALAAVSLAVPASVVLPANWGLAVMGACGFCVSATALTVWPAASPPGPAGRLIGQRLDVAAGSAAILAAVTTLVALPSALVAVIPPNRLQPAWAGAGHGSRIANDLLSGSHLRGATVLLVLCALACMLVRLRRAAVPARFRAPTGAAGVAAATLAAGSLPAAARVTGWGALFILTISVAALLVASVCVRDVLLGNVAAACGGVIAVDAALWSLAGPAKTLGELSALAVIFAFAALRARRVVAAALATTGVLASVTGLAWAVPLAVGWPTQRAAFAALGVAVAAVTAATALRRIRPVHSAVLDLGAIPVALVAAAVTVGQQEMFAFVAVASAMAASGTAWFRTGPRKVVAVAAAAAAALAALTALGRPLGQALLAPVRILAHPWHGHELAGGGALPAGLPLAVIVLAASLAAVISAAGAWRGSGRASLDAVAVALPLVAAPAGLAGLNGELAYLAVVGLLLALTLGLTAWAAIGDSLAPAGAALLSAALTVAWALAAPLPTLTVLGCLSVGYGVCAWRSRLQVVRVAASCLSVLVAAAFAESIVVAAGQAGWQAGLVVLAVAGGAQLVAALLARRARWRVPEEARTTQAQTTEAQATEQFPPGFPHIGEAWAASAMRADLAIEITGWLVAAAGIGQCLGRPAALSAATAIAGITCLGVAARPDRRPAVWAGLALCYVAWCIGLAASDVYILELYTGPAALWAIAAGWTASRREPRPHSWLAYGPGLALLLLPSLIADWDGNGWIRPVAVGAAAVAVAIVGARTRTQAPLIAGTSVAVLDAARALAPGVTRLMHTVPGWVPVAAGGAVLLWAGATYEARLRNLRAIRRSLASMS
jgi:hypothetical protein